MKAVLQLAEHFARSGALEAADHERLARLGLGFERPEAHDQDAIPPAERGDDHPLADLNTKGRRHDAPRGTVEARDVIARIRGRSASWAEPLAFLRRFEGVARDEGGHRGAHETSESAFDHALGEVLCQRNLRASMWRFLSFQDYELVAFPWEPGPAPKAYAYAVGLGVDRGWPRLFPKEHLAFASMPLAERLHVPWIARFREVAVVLRLRSVQGRVARRVGRLMASEQAASSLRVDSPLPEAAYWALVWLETSRRNGTLELGASDAQSPARPPPSRLTWGRAILLAEAMDPAGFSPFFAAWADKTRAAIVRKEFEVPPSGPPYPLWPLGTPWFAAPSWRFNVGDNEQYTSSSRSRTTP